MTESNKLMILTMALSVLFLLIGCATESKYRTKLETWNGHPVSDLITSAGEPSQVVKLDNGSNLYRYSSEVLVEAEVVKAQPGVLSQREKPQGHIDFGHYSISYGKSGQKEYAIPPSDPIVRSYEYHCVTQFEINPNGTIVGISFWGNHCVSK